MSGYYTDVTVMVLCQGLLSRNKLYRFILRARDFLEYTMMVNYIAFQLHSILQLSQSSHDLYRVFLACCFQDIGIL